MVFQIDYISGLAKFNKPQQLNLRIEPNLNTIFFSGVVTDIEEILFENIIDISFVENYKRSAGKTATGALIGGLATGGIGVIAGAAIGARRSKDNRLFIIYKIGNLEQKIILKGRNLNQIQSAILSAINQESIKSTTKFSNNIDIKTANSSSEIHKETLTNIASEQKSTNDSATTITIVVIVLLILFFAFC